MTDLDLREMVDNPRVNIVENWPAVATALRDALDLRWAIRLERETDRIARLPRATQQDAKNNPEARALVDRLVAGEKDE